MTILNFQGTFRQAHLGSSGVHQILLSLPSDAPHEIFGTLHNAFFVLVLDKAMLGPTRESIG